MTRGLTDMLRKLVFFLLLGTLWTGAAQAQFQRDGWHFAGMLGWNFADGARHTEDGWWGDLAIGKTISPTWVFEFEVTGDQLDFENTSGSLDHFGLGLNFIKVNREASWNPYFLVGAGGLQSDDGVNDSWDPMVQLGVGGMWPIASGGAAFRMDLRYRYEIAEDNFGDLILGFGFTVPFGGATTTSPGRQPAQTR